MDLEKDSKYYERIKIDTENFSRAKSYKRFIGMANPCLTITAKFDVTPISIYAKQGHKYNALMCYCISKAGQKVKEFHYSIEEDGLYAYKYVKTNAVLKAKNGELVWGDFKYCETFEEFEKEYARVNKYCYDNCVLYQEKIGALLGTSAIIGYPFEAISVPNLPDFQDTFLIWGSYEKIGDKFSQNISIRFHHALMDGEHIALFCQNLQEEFNSFTNLIK